MAVFSSAGYSGPSALRQPSLPFNFACLATGYTLVAIDGSFGSAAALFSSSRLARIIRSVAIVFLAARLSLTIEGMQLGLPARTVSRIHVAVEALWAVIGSAA